MTEKKPKPALFELKHPFFKPLWVRIALVVACCGWGLYDLATGAPMWGMMFLGSGLYAGWGFFLSADRHYFNTPDEDPDKPN